MSELFDTIEMKALDAAERERLAQEQKQIEHKRAVKAKRNKATRTMLSRAGGAVLVCLALWLAGKFDLMNDNLVLGLYAAIFSWLCLWIGGWVQFMFCKGGLFEC
jgi:ferric-dicitrate binding protein FerR (iron transport regulator)